MADFGAPVAQNIDPNLGLKTISSLLGVKAQQQGLAGQAAQVQQEQIEAQKKQIAFNEQQAIGKLNPEQYTKNGVLDAAAYARDAIAAAPQSGMGFDRAAKAYEVQHAQLGVQSAAQTLNHDQRADASSTLAAVITNPKFEYGDIVSAADQYKKQNPAAAPVMDTMLRSLSPDEPLTTTAQKIKSLSRALLSTPDLSGTGGLNTPAPVVIDNNSTFQGGTQSRITGGLAGSGPVVSKGLAPQVISNPTTGGPAQVGGGAGTTPRPIGGDGAGSGVNTWQPYSGQQKDISANQDEVRHVRAQGDQAPLNRNINTQILRLSRDAKTGPGTEAWQHVIGAVGAPFGLSPNASYQEVGKMLEKNAINNMQAMGGQGSDARLSAAAAANGSTHFNPEALQAVTKFNDATNTAFMKYRQGIDQAVGTRKPDYTALADFKAAWAKNFDVDVFRVEDAIRNKDDAELAKIKRELGAERMKDLAAKRRNLESLSATGELPK